jgi:hypothetical protein
VVRKVRVARPLHIGVAVFSLALIHQLNSEASVVMAAQVMRVHAKIQGASWVVLALASSLAVGGPAAVKVGEPIEEFVAWRCPRSQDELPKPA